MRMPPPLPLDETVALLLLLAPLQAT